MIGAYLRAAMRFVLATEVCLGHRCLVGRPKTLAEVSMSFCPPPERKAWRRRTASRVNPWTRKPRGCFGPFQTDWASQ